MIHLRCWPRWCAVFGVARPRLPVVTLPVVTLTVAALTVVTLTVGVTSAGAGAPTDALRDFFGAVNVVLEDPRTEGPQEKLRAIRRHVDDVFDFREAAMLALGREWHARTPLEQNEFVALFADLLERSFVWRVAGKASLGGGVKVDYLGETAHGDSVTVDTALAARDGNDLRLQFRMVRRAERWVVRDVVMDGVSTMENYHAQFQRVVRDASWRDLVSQLRAKLGAPAAGVQVAAAGKVAAPPVSPPPPVVAPLNFPVIERAVADVPRDAVARDVAAVVTPGLALREAPVPARREMPPLAANVSPDLATDAGMLVAPRTKRGGDAAISPSPSPMLAAITPARQIEPPKPTRPAIARQPETVLAYWIQVGAFRNATAAGRVAAQVKGEILVVAPSTPSGTRGEPLLRVRVGPFPDRARAASRLREIQSLGYRPFIASD